MKHSASLNMPRFSRSWQGFLRHDGRSRQEPIHGIADDRFDAVEISPAYRTSGHWYEGPIKFR